MPQSSDESDSESESDLDQLRVKNRRTRVIDGEGGDGEAEAPFDLQQPSSLSPATALAAATISDPPARDIGGDEDSDDDDSESPLHLPSKCSRSLLASARRMAESTAAEERKEISRREEEESDCGMNQADEENEDTPAEVTRLLETCTALHTQFDSLEAKLSSLERSVEESTAKLGSLEHSVAKATEKLTSAQSQKRKARDSVDDSNESSDGDFSDAEPQLEPDPSDPNAPRRNVSAWTFFFRAMKQAHPDLSFSDLMQEINQLWTNFSAEEEAEYEQRAAEDKKRYDREMAIYLGTPQRKKARRERIEDESHADAEDEGERSGDGDDDGASEEMEESAEDGGGGGVDDDDIDGGSEEQQQAEAMEDDDADGASDSSSESAVEPAPRIKSMRFQGTITIQFA